MFKRLISLLITILVFSLSWTDAFSLGQWFPIHVMVTILIVILFLMQTLNSGLLLRQAIKNEDILLFIFISTLLLSGIINYTEKSFNYILAYTLTFIFQLLLVRLAIYTNLSVDKLLKVNLYSILFISAFVILEFSLGNFLNIDIQDYIPRHRKNTAIFGGTFIRSYGMATEPGVLSFYYNTMAPIGLWYLWKKMSLKKVKKIVFSTLVLIAFITTFSSAGISFLILSIGIVGLLNIHKYFYKRFELRKILLLIFTLIVVFLGIIYSPVVTLVYDNYLNPIISKVTFSEDAYSAKDRMNRWQRSMDEIKENPILGQGLGSTTLSGKGSSTNWYMFLTKEAGIISLLPIIIYLTFNLVKIFRSNIRGRSVYLFSYIAGLMHLSVMSTFYHPFLWILLIFFNFHNDYEGYDYNQVSNNFKLNEYHPPYKIDGNLY